MVRPLSDCPVCGSELHVSELACGECRTVVRNTFDACRYCALGTDQSRMLETFLRNRGNLSSVASELGVSFPTAARRLDALLEALHLSGPRKSERTARRTIDTDAARRRVLEELDSGEITAQEATRRIAGI